MTERLIMLGVYTTDDEIHFPTYQDFAQLAANLSAVHNHVHLSSNVVEELEYDPKTSEEELHYDDETLDKVHTAINKAVSLRLMSMVYTNGNPPQKLSEMIVNELQNAGILFRERRPS